MRLILLIIKYGTPLAIETLHTKQSRRQPSEVNDMTDSSQNVYGRDNFPHLFKPGQIGRFHLNNRVKYAACSVSNYNSYDGFVSSQGTGPG